MGICGSVCQKEESRKDVLMHQRQILQDIEYKECTELLYNFKEAKVIKVYDGDTFWVAAWFNSGIYRFKVRLWGIDCPEIRGGTEETKQAARESKQFVVDTVLGKIVGIDVLNHKVVDGKKVEEKYGRLLSKITYDLNGKKHNLTEDMLRLKLGKPYFGGKKD